MASTDIQPASPSRTLDASVPLHPSASPGPVDAADTLEALAHEVQHSGGMIDPELMALPPPPHTASSSNGAAGGPSRDPTAPMGITESIASAPPPRQTEFTPMWDEVEGIDLDALEVDAEAPGSPTAKIMRAVAPPNAIQPDSKWPAPPMNASVNLFIGRALLANGNDNWPLKPNDIVSWIRKHYPAEWDGDEGRCSAHRVRTYLARKGADMYYEKLNQGCIAGWRIRQNHVWRFENGGFQGRGMKQEEAIAAAQKENEALATAAHKAAAAEALAAGHPNVKTSMSQVGISDMGPIQKKQKLRVTGQARRRSTKQQDDMMMQHAQALVQGVTAGVGADHHQQQQYYDQSGYATLDQHQHSQPSSAAGPSHPHAGVHLDPTLHQHQHQHQHQQPDSLSGASNGNGVGADQVDMNMVQQALQAAAAGTGQMDELDMGIQLPIEMQIHGDAHEEASRYREDAGYYGPTGQYGQGQYASAYYGQPGYGYQHGQGQ